MFKLNKNYEDDRRILKGDCIRYSPTGLSTVNNPNSQIILIYLEKTVLLVCYLVISI